MRTASLESVRPAPSLVSQLRALAGDIKLSHSIFAMPWALLSTFLAAEGVPRAGELGLIVACMVLARTVAMSVNRLLDADLDAQNPRTARRAIPDRRVSRRFVAAAAVLCSGGFVAATAGFGLWFDNWLPLLCSIPVLAFLCGYPLLKRFSQLCHFYLGAALGLAPICAWVAIDGTPPVEIWLMGLAVLLWTAGFDILYACQDIEIDRRDRLHSVPARWGLRRALWVSRITHLLTWGLIIAVGVLSPQLGAIYLAAAVVTGLLLVLQHHLVKSDDLSRLNLAFFTTNGVIAVLLGTAGILEVLL